MNALIRGFRGYFLVDDAPWIVSQLRALDNEIEKAAGALLPISLRHDMAWLARERLAPAESADYPGGTAASDPANIIGAYPTHRGAAPSYGSAEPSDGRDTAQKPIADSEIAEPRHQPQGSQAEDTADDKDGVLIDGRLCVFRRT